MADNNAQLGIEERADEEAIQFNCWIWVLLTDEVLFKEKRKYE